MTGNPLIIQGGMGVGVSNWNLAGKVSKEGHLGVVSGTALDVTFVRRLQSGDEGGHMRRALSKFPIRRIEKWILDKYFVEGGIKKRYDFAQVPMFTINPSRELLELTVAANFVEVYLAKEGHNGLVGINYLEKIQLPNLPSIYGAMLAAVDYIIVGAGIPLEFPGVLDDFVSKKKVSISLTVEGAEKGDNYRFEFDPSEIIGEHLPDLIRPKFLGIVSSNVLAMTMAKRATGKVDGLIIEEHTAGGHNAPPRGAMQLTIDGEPVYGEKDSVDFEKLKKLGLPFWLAGDYGTLSKLNEAKAYGAEGVQVGTPFALCKESGLLPEIKEKLIKAIRAGYSKVFTDPVASPTGFPFKIIKLFESLSEISTYLKRPRVCNLGYLRHLYKTIEGHIGYRCPAEPVKAYTAKEGDIEETKGRKCLCNALLANIGFPKLEMNGYLEKALVTAGEHLSYIQSFLKSDKLEYTVKDVIQSLMVRYQLN